MCFALMDIKLKIYWSLHLNFGFHQVNREVFWFCSL